MVLASRLLWKRNLLDQGWATILSPGPPSLIQNLEGPHLDIKNNLHGGKRLSKQYFVVALINILNYQNKLVKKRENKTFLILV